MASVARYLEAFARSFAREDSKEVAALLNLRNCFGSKNKSAAEGDGGTNVTPLVRQLFEEQQRDAARFTRVCEQQASAVGIPNDMGKVCAEHLTVCAFLVRAAELDRVADREAVASLLGDAIRSQFAAQKALLSIYEEQVDEGSDWLMETMKAVLHCTRVLAAKADQFSADPSKQEFQAECKRQSDNVIRTFIKKRVLEKKMILLYAAIASIKVIFALQTYNLSRNIIKQVENPSFPDLDVFPHNERVMYYYYLGRLLTFEDRLEEARRYFESALNSCPSNSKSHSKAILEYLVPINLFFGRRPTQLLLKTHSLEYFQELIDALRKGDVRAVESWTNARQELFIARGLFLSFDTLKLLAYRNLFRNLVAIRTLKDGDKFNQVPLEYLIDSFLRFGESDPMDLFSTSDPAAQTDPAEKRKDALEQLKCVLGNLIHKRLLKGYISHEKNVMVIAPEVRKAFPSINNEQWW